MPLDDILNFRQVSPLISCAGMPKAEAFEAVRDAGFDVVINLALPSHPDAVADEAQRVTRAGMTYVHIPVDFDQPRPSDYATFAAVMQANRDRRVFVHCALNYRASAFVYLFRRLQMGVAPQEALQDLEAIWQPEGVWEDFIEDMLEAGDV